MWKIYNAADVDYDLSGYYLSNDLHMPIQYTFPGGTIVPPGGYLVVSDVEVFPSRGELGLFKPTTLEEGAGR